MEFVNSFWVGGLICVAAQFLIDKTKLTPARILVLYVCTGAVLGAVGLYKPIADYAGCGATVPISGFGYSLAKGVKTAVEQKGFIGIFTGGIGATAAGITAAVFFGFLFALVCKPKSK